MLRENRTIRPSRKIPVANGSIGRYSRPAPGRSSSAGIRVMLMMLWAAAWVLNRWPGIVSSVRDPPAGLVGRFQHDHAAAGAGEIARGDQAVVATADDQDRG